ncbi:glycoside hydrolase family 28 [Paraburkholderia sp. NMBU_R16]|uniref:glycosyl hydrolase family 28 protein n=1 Tax=Paraburkholderia sp. NMBU_R16 TaxID=2698676 RepID=UPI001564A3E5|nr:glycosyl hydrolase family 28 protein [Paraburkholderia sp. NMBU_R16]NRO94635.1 glycoside hydrolase family 28 [Paraburkholderia sp. NMBU_R16]
MKTKRKLGLLFAGILFVAGSAHAQTLATGDSRTVTEPVYPAVCKTLYANFSSSLRSSPPSTDDTSRIQDALTACAGTGQSVVLAPSGSNDAFYTGSLTINGAGLVIGPGATLIGNNYASNANLLAFSGTHASLMGPGTVDGRGDLISGTPRLVQASKISNFIVYNITLTQAAHPNLYVEGGNGFTAWGVSIRTPATRKNADGIDIDSLTNATVIHSTIEAGDDGIAIKTNSGNISNVTVSDTRLYGTHGLSVGSIDKNTVSNILFTDNYVYGYDLNGMLSTNDNGINVKTGPCSLTVKNVSYVNTCMIHVKHMIVMDTNYNSCTTGGSPALSNIFVNGAYSIQSVSGAYTKIAGLNSSYPVGAYLANINLDATGQNGDQYANVGLYNSNDVPAGTGVATSSFTTTGSVPSCSF